MSATPRLPAMQETLFAGAPQPLESIYSAEQIVDQALIYWRTAGFPYRREPLHLSMHEVNRLAALPDGALLGTDIGYHTADTFHPHRFEASADGMLSPLQAFHRDDLLRRALTLCLTSGQAPTATALASKLAIVSGTQACSNFRPGMALAIYREFGRHGMVVLDTSSGYGGRLLGWCASGLGGRYIGIDPSAASCDGSRQMAAALGYAGSAWLINAPAEEVQPAMITSAVGQVDLAFTSPPYFVKERYAEGHHDESRQSWRRYRTEAEWRAGFLQPMMLLQAAVLRPGGVAVLNVADVKIGGRVHALTEWCHEAAAEAGLVRIGTDLRMRLQRRFGQGLSADVAVEPVYAYQRPAGLGTTSLDPEP